MSAIEDMKKLLKGTFEEKTEIIERLTKQRLAVLLSVEEVPEKFDYIVTNVSMKRFGRLENEGMSSYSQEGLSYTFNDNDFSEFMSEIHDFKIKQEKEANSKIGKVRFI